MNLPIKKIISASAGTGKTYRLSLEYIALILKHWNTKDFKPEQILVITFTRKATAEIRDRIYRHLEMLSNGSEGWKELAVNLWSLTGSNDRSDRDNPLTDNERLVIKAAFRHLCTHKDELQVMTIDSYVHAVFRNLIRPVKGIDRFELDYKAADDRIPFLFDKLMQPELLKRIQGLLSRKIKPSIDDYQKFFRSLINNRWLSYLANSKLKDAPQGTVAYYSQHQELWQQQSEVYLQRFKEIFEQIIINFTQHLQLKEGLTLSEMVRQGGWMSKDYYNLFKPLPTLFSDLVLTFESNLGDEDWLLELLNLLEKDKFIWNGTKLRQSQKFTELDVWKDMHKQAQEQLANYLVFKVFLPEQKEITDIWTDVLKEYDKLIYRYKNFTYDDITWFTFEGLYSSHPPLFRAEPEAVANEFYEFMCYRTRFMLIDEFQDTSILQFHILSPMIEELLSGSGSYSYGGLIVVGDEKQSIFGWRGGQRDLLLNLDKIFQREMPAQKDALTDSWRSSPTLMMFINGIFDNNALQTFLNQMGAEWVYNDVEGKKTELESDTKIGVSIQNHASHSYDNKAEHVMRRFIREMVIPALPKTGQPSRSIAILARKNIELEMIRAILAENGITSEFQSSRSLLEHPIIKAIIYLLRFSLYKDWYDFLAFLRSDIVLLDAVRLKQVIEIIAEYEQNRQKDKQIPDFSSIPEAMATWDLTAKLDRTNIFKSIMTILQECQIQHKLPLQRDYANIQRFLDLALDYERDFQSELPELQGFLRWCEDNHEQEVMQQQDVESSTAVQLLTIHKSKGLEFDSVFVWWNLKGQKGREEMSLDSWEHYSDINYKQLNDLALTLHYKQVLKFSSFSEMMQEDEKRLQLEELNNLYVALTRARNSLYLFVTYDKKEGWDSYISNLTKEDKWTPQHYAVRAVLEYMQQQGEPISENTWQIVNQPLADKLSETYAEQQLLSEKHPFTNLSNILPDWQKPTAELVQNENTIPLEEMKTSFLVNRDNLKGNIAHYFLAQLKYATEEEIAIATILTLRKYGNLMRSEELQSIINTIRQQLPDLMDIFSTQYDLVFTEYPIYHEGKEHRLDRLMLNTKAKTYRIVDYKTGQIFHKEQLDIYKSILKDIVPNDYTCEPESSYVDILIDN